MLLMTKSLMESLEKQAFEQFTQSNQTQLGSATPRGDALAGDLPEDPARRLADALRTSFAGVSSLPHEGRPGSKARSRTRSSAPPARCCKPAPPFLLMTLRGRLYLRLQLASADETDIAAALACSRRPAPKRSASQRREAERRDRPAEWKGAPQACLPSSILAMALRCTSSGPSAKRRVRAAA